MKREGPRNLPASVRQRLMNVARDLQEDFQSVLTRYANERFLYRVSRSTHAQDLIVKGAVLFHIWRGRTHRATRDLDMLARGPVEPSHFENLFRGVVEQDVIDDGLEFVTSSVRSEPIRQDQEYQGLRMRLEARLGNARISLQVDLGFGDVVTPAPMDVTYPTLLDFPAPKVRAYPRETVVAEKYQAMIMLDMANSRLKDFFDLWTLAREFDFAGPSLGRAILATFDRRRTELPKAPPLALTSEFFDDDSKVAQWSAFLRKNKLDAHGVKLAEVCAVLREFLVPPTMALVSRQEFDMNWPPHGPWT